METPNNNTVEKKTAVSNNDRKRKHRNNMSEARKDKIKEADRLRKQLKRSKEKLTKDEIDDRRKKDRVRQQRHRAEKGQQEMHAIINMGFKTKQSKGKVMRRVNNALPSTPTKKAEVVKELFQSLTPSTKSNFLVLFNFQRN